MMWQHAQNGSDERPREVDDLTSRKYVYVRRNGMMRICGKHIFCSYNMVFDACFSAICFLSRIGNLNIVFVYAQAVKVIG